MTRTMKPRRHALSDRGRRGQSYETGRSSTTRRFISCPSCFRGLISCAAILLVPALVGIAQADSLNVRFIGSCATHDQAWDVAISGDYAYVADYRAGLSVISIADPMHPDTVGRCDSLGRAFGVTAREGYAYVADVDSGLWVISVADPTHPARVGRYDSPGRASGVAVVGAIVYVADGDSGLRVVSVADPANPMETGHCYTPSPAFAVAAAGEYAYVATYDSGLRVISVVDPAHPIEVGYCSAGGTDVSVNGDYAYVAAGQGGMPVVSIADPAHPVVVGHGQSVFAAGVDVRGTLVYVAASGGGLRVFSVADPAHPVEVGHYALPATAVSVTAVLHYVYVADLEEGMQILQFYGGALGDLDVDPDSLDVAADTIRLQFPSVPGPYADYALGEFVLVNSSTSYNPDTTDGPSTSPLESFSFAGSLTGPRGTLDSILIPNLPGSLAQGQAVICTLAVYAPGSMSMGEYSGQIVIAGLDSLHHETADTVYALLRSFGDIDVDNDSLDAIVDTIRLRPRLASAGPPPKYTEYALGKFILVNTGESYNPDTADGPSLSPIDSLSFTGSLAGPGGTLDSVLIPNLPGSLAQGQAVVCTLAVYMPPWLQDGDYAGSITISGRDTAGMSVDEIFHALIKRTTLGDLDVDNESLDVANDTMELRTQPAGPVYSPYAKAEFMLLNTYKFYNPDTADGPSQSPLTITGYDAYLSRDGGNSRMSFRGARRRSASPQVPSDGSAISAAASTGRGSSLRSERHRKDSAYACSTQDTVGSIYLLNLPSYLEVGQAVECTLAVVLPVGASFDDYTGLVTIDGYDTLGYRVRDSFFLTVHGPEPRQSLDSLRVAPIPYKPNQNPEHDAIHFQGLTAGARVTVYDASGQSVWSQTEAGDGHLAWKAEVASGIYAYLVVTKDGQSRVGKLSVIR